MVRKAPATEKHKGSQKNETYMPGITNAADYLQASGDPAGMELDEAIERDSREKQAKDVMDVPAGGLNSDIAAPINSK